MTGQTLSIATWNINSVRLRIDQVCRFLEAHQPDVLCLQEIKCAEAQFPSKAFVTAGYPHIAITGQKGMHGVATVARAPLVKREAPDVCRAGEARLVVTEHASGLEIHNFYVPAGGDEPDPQVNPKFAHKLDFLARMTAHYAGQCEQLETRKVIVTGDLNIAPSPHDVWSHKQLLNVVSHTPVETLALEEARMAGGFTDLVRAGRPEPETLFSWWSYRARDWRASNRGRRLDHIWASPALASQKTGEMAPPNGVSLVDETRDWDKPSDHIPVMATLVV